MIRAAVIGAAGYTGAELIRWLLGHPGFEIAAMTSNEDAGKSLSSLYPALLGKTQQTLITHEDAISQKDYDVAFLAVPHTAAFRLAPQLLENGVAVVDLSADYRLKDAAVYEQWYGVSHTVPDLLACAIYGLPEINRAALKDKVSSWHNKTESGLSELPPLIANPGCYPTATTLAVAPALSAGLAALDSPIIVNAISGVSGAGRKATSTTHFCSASDDLAAYGATTHRHTPEISQVLSEIAGREISVVFTPHLAPLKRGMVATVVLSLAKGADGDAIADAYTKAYDDEPFVSLLPFGTMPHSASVMGTNNAQVGIAYDARTHSLVASCAIDNLGKGAAAQAVQNANIIFGFEETEGLKGVGLLV